MKTETIEDIKLYSGISLFGEMFLMLLEFGPVLIRLTTGRTREIDPLNVKIGAGFAVLFVFTLLLYFTASVSVKKRKADDGVGGMIRILFDFLFLRSNKEYGAVADELPASEAKKSVMIRHFGRRINVIPLLIFALLTLYLLLAIGTFLELVFIGHSVGMEIFSRHYDPKTADPMTAAIAMVVVILWLLILDIAALIRIKVSARGLKADVVNSKISLHVLDEEFKKSINIGHDIWVGEEHIFLSAGRESYMFRKDKIFDIRCERVAWNWRLFFLPAYRIIITGDGGIRQASFFTLRKGLCQKLKDAVDFIEE